MSTTLSWGERIRTLRKRLKFTQDELASLIGRSREWVSKLERDEEKPSDEIIQKIIEAERKHGVHLSDVKFTTEHLNAGAFSGRLDEPEAIYSRGVASRLPVQRTPSTRADCEAYVQQLLDAAQMSDDPNAWPVILHRLKKELPLDEWQPPRLEDA